MKSPIKIHVTQEDIDEGQPADCWECPIARATYREFPAARDVIVSPKFVSVEQHGGVRACYDLCQDGQEFIRNFDDACRRYLCKPATFELTPV